MPSKKSKPNEKLGRSIRSIREQRRYSQEGFARHAGLDRSYFGAVERGEFNSSVATLAKIAAALDTTVAALCEKVKL
jgi:transcriptional regulator with XRE-family HTH domain